MKLLKKAAIGAAFALGLSAAQATPITVGGVTWDPDYVDIGGSEFDFIAQFDFSQWYSTDAAGSTTRGTISNYDSAATIGSVLTTLAGGGSGATGYYLQGVGEYYRMNENNPLLCSGCELIFGFGGIGLNYDGSFDISNAWGRVYVNSLFPNYTHPASNQTEVSSALSGDVWLDIDFLALAFQSGFVGNGTVSALLQVTGGEAYGNFLPDLLSYTADANFINASPVCPDPDGPFGPLTPNPLTCGNKYSAGGNGSVLGNTIPEPGTLALAGLALLGIYGARGSNRKL